MAKEICNWGIGPDCEGVLVVRQGKRGCSVYWRDRHFHLKPFHMPGMDSKVVDPTGGGNAFLGSLGMAMGKKVVPSLSVFTDAFHCVGTESQSSTSKKLGELLAAVVFATIAASFVIEQAGPPVLSYSPEGKELWNGESFEERVLSYIDREKDYIFSQLEFN